MTKIVSFASLAMLGLMALPPGVATAQPAPPPTGPAMPLEYAVKYVCGTNPIEGQVTTLVASGNYYTAVNIHNPFKENKVTYKVALALQGEPGPMTGFQPAFPLKYDQAMDVDCRLIRARLQQAHIATPPFITGFLVVQSARELDVVGVYTAAGAVEKNQVVSIDVERVPVRRVMD
jgi:hypothetical protein